MSENQISLTFAELQQLLREDRQETFKLMAEARESEYRAEVIDGLDALRRNTVLMPKIQGVTERSVNLRKINQLLDGDSCQVSTNWYRDKLTKVFGANGYKRRSDDSGRYGLWTHVNPNRWDVYFVDYHDRMIDGGDQSTRDVTFYADSRLETVPPSIRKWAETCRVYHQRVAKKKAEAIAAGKGAQPTPKKRTPTVKFTQLSKDLETVTKSTK